MAAANFAPSLALVLRLEGGFVDHPDDPGGATRFGITQATLARSRGHPVTREDVRRLSREEAGAIYRRLYWNAVRGDDLPAGIDLAVFDGAVHSGPRAAARLLQAELGVPVDGIVGEETLAAARSADAAALIRRFIGARRASLRKLPTWPVFGRGWNRRLRAIEEAALRLARAEPEA
jgi:lysozyme family protein